MSLCVCLCVSEMCLSVCILWYFEKSLKPCNSAFIWRCVLCVFLCVCGNVCTREIVVGYIELEGYACLYIDECVWGGIFMGKGDVCTCTGDPFLNICVSLS